MEKILINLYVPSINQSFDIFVPCEMRVKSLVRLLASTIENFSMNEYLSSFEEIICDINGNVMNQNNCLLDYNDQNGDRLLLI